MLRKTRKKRYLWIGIAVVAAILLAILLRPQPVPVETAKVTRGDLVLDLSTTGVVEGNVADISPRIIGEVQAILVDEGDPVKQGQVVAQLDQSELQADADRARASLIAAQTQVSRAVQSLSAERRQVNAQISRARSTVSAARARLAELEAGTRPQQIREAQAAVRLTEAQSDNAQADLRRAQQLYSQGAISRQQFDTKQTQARVAEANAIAARERLSILREGARAEQIAAARAEVRSSEAALNEALAGRDFLEAREEEVRTARAQADQAQAVLDAAQARLGQTTITSPVTGTVVRKHAEVGETAGPQQAIVTVSRSGPIWIAAEVDQEEVAAIAKGQQVRISLDAYPGRYAEGLVTNVSDVAVPKEVGRVRAKVVRARIDVQNSPITLRPGMEVDIDGSLKVADNVLLAPNDAVLRVGDEDVVYRVNNGVADRTEITPGLSNFDYTIVRKGLNIGQRIAITNVDKLKDGQHVKIVEERK